MAEILGAVASATQLAVMTMGLLNTIKKIKAGSKTLKKYQQQLQEVQVLSETISHNPLLQTPDVDFYTRSILVNISQNNLEHRLQRGWLSRTCTFLYKDRDLVDFFIILDRQKSNLSLVIENIQSRALHQIQSDIRAMGKPSPPFENPSTPPDSDTEASPIPSPKYTEPQTMDGSSKSSASQGQARKTTKPSDSKPEVADHVPQDTYAAYEAKMIRELDMNTKVIKKWQADGTKGCHYYDNEAGDGASMHLGPYLDAGLIPDDSKPLDLNSATPDTYTLNRSVGRGDLTLGVWTGYSGAETLNENNPQPISYTALYRGNHGVRVKKKDFDDDAESWAAPGMYLGPLHVRKKISSAGQQLAHDRAFVHLPQGMTAPGLNSDQVNDQVDTNKEYTSS